MQRLQLIEGCGTSATVPGHHLTSIHGLVQASSDGPLCPSTRSLSMKRIPASVRAPSELAPILPAAGSALPAQQIRQLGEVRRHAAGLLLGSEEKMAPTSRSGPG